MVVRRREQREAFRLVEPVPGSHRHDRDRVARRVVAAPDAELAVEHDVRAVLLDEEEARGVRVDHRLRPEIELEIGSSDAQLAQGARLELADALARDAEAGADLLERLRRSAVEAETQR